MNVFMHGINRALKKKKKEKGGGVIANFFCGKCPNKHVEANGFSN